MCAKVLKIYEIRVFFCLFYQKKEITVRKGGNLYIIHVKLRGYSSDFLNRLGKYWLASACMYQSLDAETSCAHSRNCL